MNFWQPTVEGILVYSDSCNVYAVPGTNGAWLIINAGTGAAADHLPELGSVRNVTLALTHYFRDHSAGVEKFRQAGVTICAPFGEREHLSGEQSAMRNKPTYFQYDLTWDHFAPIQPVRIDRWLMDYERTNIAGLPLEVIPTPGVTMGAASYAVTLPGDCRIAFIGELMHSPGRLARLSPLQYNYNDLTGVENTLLSCDRVLATTPVKVFPSLGRPFGDFQSAVVRLRDNYAAFDQIQPGIAARLNVPPPCGVEAILPRMYRGLGCSAETHFIIGRTGRVLALDYGHDTAQVRFPNRLVHWTRRPLLHSFADLQAKTGAKRIDTVLATHYHDDHVAGVPLLQRLHGTELWAGENFADLLEHPQDFDRPCLWPEPMKVACRLPLGVKTWWEDVAITLHPMTGHTEFSTLICLEFDGRRIAHTGDQIFFLHEINHVLTTPEEGKVFTNHVYRNGLALGGYVDCIRHLRAFDPELVLSGHAIPYRPTPGLWPKLEQAAAAFDTLHRNLMPLADDDIHFGAESQPAKLFPYRLHLSASQTSAQLTGWVLNPFNRTVTAELVFVTPHANWQAKPLRLILQAREKHPFATTLHVTPSPAARPELIALELEIDGQPFGQAADVWVTAD